MQHLREPQLPHQAQAEQGVALIVVLVFLVLVTITGLSAMQTSMLEERMAGNAVNRQVAFQSAEAGLSAGESLVKKSNCHPGAKDLHPKIEKTMTDPENWTDKATHTVKLKKQGTDDTDRRTQTGQYVVVRLDGSSSSPKGTAQSRVYADSFRLYRITAKGFGRTESVGAILQATYRCRE